MIYLSGCTGPSYEADLIDLGIGLMLQPASYRVGRVVPFGSWAADNGCYPPDDDPRRKVPWSAATWARMLGAISDLPPEVQGRCLFALVPDVPFDHLATLRRFDQYAPIVRAFGLPLAFAIQDGATEDSVPWDEVDVVFLAGSTEWKLGRPAMDFAYRARARGKPVHMGRVNSARRLERWAAYIGVDSCDGTFIKHGPPETMVAQLREWLSRDTPRLTQMVAMPS